jgi:formylglycine-generating enzyme required for sulfatase activity
VLVAILSPDAKASKWVREELDYAQLHGKPIYLLLGRGDERSAVPFGFITTQWLDIRDNQIYGESLGRLVESVRRTIGGLNTPHSLGLTPPNVRATLPDPFEWCGVTGGRVKIDDATRYGGTSGGVYEVNPFFIAKYPITNLQYQVFVDAADGYRSHQWWSYSPDAWRWREANPTPKATAFNGADLPRTNVNWYDALAFCRWLMAQLPAPTQAQPLFTLTLPIEAQWQRAAQGDDRRRYAWGDAFHKTYCNTQESGHEKPTSVLTYPQAASPFGVMDMNGNTWEWCLTGWSTGSDSLYGIESRVLRGGSWLSLANGAETTTRFDFDPDFRGLNVGFRIVALVHG